MDLFGWYSLDPVVTEGRFGVILDLRDVFLVPRMWFFRFQNPFHVVIISILDTALQTHRYTDMASKRGHSFTATQKSGHGFRDKRKTDFNKNGWGRDKSSLPRILSHFVGSF